MLESTNNKEPVLTGQYTTIDGVLYFVTGTNRVKVAEHFPDNGPKVADLLEDGIKHAIRSA